MDPKTLPLPPAAPSLRFDWQDWLPYLEDADMSLDQKQSLIETLWSIVAAFVDLGWQVKPAAEICGQTIDLKAALEAAVLRSDDVTYEQEDNA